MGGFGTINIKKAEIIYYEFERVSIGFKMQVECVKRGLH